MKAENSERKTLTFAEAARLLGIGRNAAYDAVKKGSNIKLGDRIVVPTASLRRMLGIETEAA